MVDPRHIRPRRLWYGVGAGIVVLGMMAGAAAFAVGLFRLVALPEFAAEFSDGRTAAFTVDAVAQAGSDWQVYSTPPQASDSVACEVSGPDPDARVEPPSHSHTVSGGGAEWGLMGTVALTETGEYEITCSGAGQARYGVGLGRDAQGFLTGTGWTLGWTMAPMALGALLGGIVLFVTGLRRRRHRQRLAYRPQGL